MRKCEQILRAYGAPFLQYIFALDDQTVSLELLAEQESTILDELRTIAVTPSLEGTFEIDVSYNALNHFLSPSSSESGRATQLRREAHGNALTAPSTDDDFLANLFELATVFWPGIVLLKGWQDSVHRLGVSNGVRIFGTEVGSATALALLADQHLSKLFPSPDPEMLRLSPSVVRCDWMFSAEVGGQVTATVGQVIEQMLQISAVRLEALEGSWKFEDYCAKLVDTVDGYRKLAQGRQVSFPVLIGIAGLSGNGFDRLKFNAHTLRKASALDSHLLSRFGTGSHTLTLEMPTKLLSHKFIPPDQRAADKRYSDLAAMVDTEANAIRLAILLGVRDASRVASTRLFTRFLSPRGPGASEIWSGSNLENFERSDGHVLASDEASNILDTYRVLKPRLDELHNSTMAVHRLLQAAGNRTRSTDSFIDAFIAIESLLSPGGSADRLTDKLSDAAGVLLETSPENQTAVAQELSELYSLRSDIVHGNRNAPNELIFESQRTIEIACRIISAICFQEDRDFRSMRASKRNSLLRSRKSRRSPMPRRS